MADEDRRPALNRFAPLVSAFFELSTERPIGFGIGPIPMSKVMEYLDRYGLPSWWAQVISAADAVVLDLLSERNS